MLQKLSIGLKFLGFQRQDFAVGQKILEICEIKFRGWQKILIFAGIKFRDLAKKITKPKSFLPAKIFDNTVMPTDLDVLRQNESKSYCKNILANT